MKIGALIIQTEDLDAILDFYVKSLGVDQENITRIRDEHAGFNLENLYFGFDKVKEKIKKKDGFQRPIIWFNAKDVEELFNTFVKNGASIVYKPTKELTPGQVLAELKDPQGNNIGVIGPDE